MTSYTWCHFVLGYNSISCEVGPKRWFWGPRFIGEGIPQILNMRFQIAVTSMYVTDFG